MSPIQLDHVFVFTPPEANISSRLIANGFLEGSRAVHPGQGTTNRRFFFDNSYLEFIWSTNETEMRSPAIQATKLWERSNWKNSGYSPLGVGLRFAKGIESTLPFPSWEYKPPYLPPNVPIHVADNALFPHEPFVFLYPLGVRPDSKAISTREPLIHPNGAKEVTSVKITMPVDNRYSEAVSSLNELGLTTFLEGPEYLMELILDHGRQGGVLDLRPDLPLMLKW